MRTQSYLFSKDKGWTKEKAKSWFKSHQSGSTKKEESEENKEKSLRSKIDELREKQKYLNSKSSNIHKTQDREILDLDKRREEDKKKIYDKYKKVLNPIYREQEDASNELRILEIALGNEMAD